MGRMLNDDAEAGEAFEKEESSIVEFVYAMLCLTRRI